jgi:ubiquitin C-terminal hydrolase
MGLHLGNTYYRAALQTIVNCQELVEMFQVNRRILLHPVPMDPEMSSYHYNVLLRQRRLLSQVMQKFTNTLQEEQLELARAIQCMMQDDHIIE